MYLFNLHSEEAPEHQVKHFLLRGLSLTNALVTDTENHLISATASTVKGARFPPTPKGLPHPQPPFLPVAAIPYSQEIRCSQGSFPETPRVDGCEDFTEGLGHLQNLQRGRSKAGEIPQKKPAPTRIGQAAFNMVEPRWAPSNSCGVKIALAPLEGCRAWKDGGHEPLGVHCSILQEICSAQVGKEMLDEIQRWNQQEVLLD